MLLLLFVVGSSCLTLKHENRLLYAACRLGKHCCAGDQFARLVHGGVRGSPRVMVHHARVVVGATIYYHGPIHKL